MSDTMSSPSDQWAQFYQHGHNPYGQAVTSSNGTATTTVYGTIRATTTGYGGQATDDATVTTTITSSSSTAHLNPDQGRVSKPIRRRSRASRRTPTTLFNTDTTNFRAMVQQFTGGAGMATAPLASRMSLHGIGATNFDFHNHHHVHHPRPTSAVMDVPYGYNIMQFQQQQQQQQQCMFLQNNNSNSPSDDHGFFQRLIGSNSTRPSMEAGSALRVSQGSDRLGPSVIDNFFGFKETHT